MSDQSSGLIGPSHNKRSKCKAGARWTKLLPQIVSLATSEVVHGITAQKKRQYIESPRSNYRQLASATLKAEQSAEAAFGLWANNDRARIAFARIAVRQASETPDLIHQPSFFVTLTPAACATLVGDEGERRETAGRARVTRSKARLMIARLRRGTLIYLRDVRFVAAVDVALYKNWGPNGPDMRDWLSYHVHLVCWGVARPRLEQLLQPVRCQYASMRKGSSSVHIQQVTSIEAAVSYMLKAPQKATRINHFPSDWVSPTTGQIFASGYVTQKDWLRTGDRVRVGDVMAGLRLDEIVFGNVSPLAAKICNELRVRAAAGAAQAKTSLHRS